MNIEGLPEDSVPAHKENEYAILVNPVRRTTRNWRIMLSCKSRPA